MADTIKTTTDPTVHGMVVVNPDGSSIGGSGNTSVVGNVASGTTDSGSPVKVGAKYNSTLPTFTNGQRGDLQIGTRGSLHVEIFANNGLNTPGIVAAADTLGNPTSLEVLAMGMVYDGANYNRARSIVNANDTIGTGIAATGMLAQFDDTTPGTVTENRFGNIRMSVRRELYDQIRDAAGNERGLNISANNAALVAGDIAHDGVDSGSPVKVGGRAIAHGANPTAVAAADRTDWLFNRAGVPFVIGGHPNVICVEAAYTAAQTDAAIITASSGTKIVVTGIDVMLAGSNTVDVGWRVGFGAANTPTTTGVVSSHPGAKAGSGLSKGDGSGILGIGGDGEDLRITCDAPTTGSIRVIVHYYTIES